MTTTGTFGTFTELIAAAELYGFVVHVFHRDASYNYTCYEAGTTGNTNIDRKKLRLFLLFTGPTDAGHFRRLDPSIVPTIIQARKYQQIDISSASQLHNNKITIKRCSIHQKPITNSEKEASSSVKDNTPVKKLARPRDSTETINPAEPMNQENQPGDNNATETTTVTCDICKQTFPTKRGLSIHRNRHANEANATTASQLSSRLTRTTSAKADSTEHDAPSNEPLSATGQAVRAALDSEYNIRQKTFEKYESSEEMDINAFEEDMANFMKFLFKANQRLPGHSTLL